MNRGFHCILYGLNQAKEKPSAKGNGLNIKSKSIRIATILSVVLIFLVKIPPASLGSQLVLSGVPEYFWWYGCTPTSGGMLVGFWDAAGYNLVDGDISVYNPTARTAIASPEHIADYYVAYNSPLPDPNPGGHVPNSLADFMHTSYFADGAADGGTSSTFIDTGLTDFATWDNPSTGVNESYNFSSNTYWTPEFWAPGTFDFAAYMASITAGIPMLLNTLVPAGGHTIVGYGFQDNGGGDIWAAVRDTWSDGATGATGAKIEGGVEWWPWITNTGAAYHIVGGVDFMPMGGPSTATPAPPGIMVFGFSLLAGLVARRRRRDDGQDGPSKTTD